MNYRSVVLFGKAALVEKQEEKMTTLRVFTEHMISGRWQDARIPDSQADSLKDQYQYHCWWFNWCSGWR